MTEKQMPTRYTTRFVREGGYAAEVEVTLIGDDDPLGWGPISHRKMRSTKTVEYYEH